MYYDQRMELARNPNTGQGVLAELAKDPDNWVRCCVARNPATSQEILAELAKDPNNRVRCEVARNPNITKDIILCLLTDGVEYIKKEAQEALKKWLAKND